MDLFNWCDRPEAVHGYVNIYEQYLYLSGIDRGLHSSFVVFYFVFVLWIGPVVTTGPIFIIMLAICM